MMIRKFSCAIAMMLSLIGFAQEFKHQATLDVPKSDGFHRIVLSPEVLGKVQTSLADLRIYDEKGAEVPYVLQGEAAISNSSIFKEYPITERGREGDSISYLIFVNQRRDVLDNVSFKVKNTAVQKRARLSGSNDQKSWFAIKDNYLLHSMHSSSATTELKILSFPLSDYAFFKLELVEQSSSRIEILSVGYYNQQKRAGLSTSFNVPIVSQTESNKQSKIVLDLGEIKYLEKIQIKLSGADYYSRSARFYKHSVIEDQKTGKQHRVDELITSVELNSNSNNEVDLGQILVQELVLEIDNRDDKPLNVEAVTASYLNKYVTADLKAGKAYQLNFGNRSCNAPSYDLNYFTNRIPTQPPTLKITGVSNPTAKKETEDHDSIFHNIYLIWGVICFVGIFLGLISFKMVRELSEKKKAEESSKLE